MAWAGHLYLWSTLNKITKEALTLTVNWRGVYCGEGFFLSPLLPCTCDYP